MSKTSALVKAERKKQSVETVSKIEHILEQRGILIERVDAASFTATDEAAGEDVLELLLKDGYTDPQAAFAAVFNIFGVKSFADKAQLASDGTPFRIRRIVQRIGGSFKEEDDWALEIVTEDGDLQVLTHERNPERDKFLYVLAVAVQRFGETQPVVLHRFDKSDETHWYAIAPVVAGKIKEPQEKNVTRGTTIEGEARVSA